MKPDWDKLMEAFDGSETQLVGDVDCTAEGKPLCDQVGVRGYPTIKWGDPNALEDYKGGRGYDELEKFAKENLKPICSPSNIDLCEPEKKSEIQKFMAMAEDELDKLIEEKEKAQEKAEEEFKKLVEGLQKQYQEANDAKEKAIDAIKESGLGLMKSVKAALGKKEEKKDEL